VVWRFELRERPRFVRACSLDYSIDFSADSKPNVLFLICDDLDYELSSYGHPHVKSPNLDRLARLGVQFNRAYCRYSVCGRSGISHMTSLYADQTLVGSKGTLHNEVYLRDHTPNVTTLSQAFRGAGHFATRIGKIFHQGVLGKN